MAEPATTGLWIIAAIVGVALIMNVLWRIAARLLGVQQVPKEQAAWIEEVRKVLFSLVDCDIDKHNLEARLAHLVGKQPPEYGQLAQAAFQRQLLLHPSMAAKAEQLGMFPRGTFERMGVPDYYHYDPTAPAPQPAMAQQPPHGGRQMVAPPSLRVVAPAPEPETTFVGTVQVQKSSNGAPN